MGRRKQEDLDFGSDSFLDIIANIVGILIILIVIAGVRVSQQALEVDLPQPEAQTKDKTGPAVAQSGSVYLPPAPLPPVLPLEPEPELVLSKAQPLDPQITAAIIAKSEPERIAPPPKPEPKPPKIMPAYIPEPLKAPAVSQELLASIASLKTDLSRLSQKSKQADQAEQRYVQWNAELTKQLDNARKTLQSGWDEASKQKRELAELKRSLERTKVVFIGKQRELTEAEQQIGPKEKLRHRLTPVSQVVEGNEIHFHVKQNRVAYVPLMELVERMKPQLQRQKEWLLKYREHNGRVGPYRGFVLDYIVVRQQMSALETARNGGMARVLPLLLKFLPQEDLPSESLAEALRPGSVFIRELQLADVNTTVTFWVYPDSYGLYRQLKEFAHAEGFTVAARPLEEDDVIQASPWGSKSAGQ